MKDYTKQKIRSLKISFSNGEISGNVYGKGRKIVLAFYGFGQSAKDLQPVFENLHDHTVYILDLPFHGDTKIYDPSTPISQLQVNEFVQVLLKQEHIERFSILGFSIGAKLVFQILSVQFERIDQVILIAPDGIKENFWYKLATGSKLMRSVFKGIIMNTEHLTSLISLAKSMKIINTSTANFAIKTIKRKGINHQLFNTWCYLRKLKLNIGVISESLNTSKVEVLFVTGKKDRIVPPKTISPLKSKLNNANMILIETDHHNLIRKFAKEM